MTTKRTTKKGAAKAAPLRRMSQREKAAHDATGYWWGEGSVRYEVAKGVLKRHGINADTSLAMLGDLVDYVGRYQMADKWLRARLAPTEIVEQALMTASIAADLADRIRYMEPNLAAIVSSLGYRAGHGPMAAEDGLEYLTRVHVYCSVAAEQIDRSARKTVTNRTAHRDRLLAQVDQAIYTHSPSMGAVKRREVAVDLMACWDIEVPGHDGDVLKQIKRGNSSEK